MAQIYSCYYGTCTGTCIYSEHLYIPVFAFIILVMIKTDLFVEEKYS